MLRTLFLCLILASSPLWATSEHHVLGLGAPCLDYFLEVNEDDLAQLNVAKGGFRVIEEEAFKTLVNTARPHIFTGSCVANTIKGLASLDIPCTLTGNIGKDKEGTEIQACIHNLGIKTCFTKTTTPTSKIACLITPDGERSFCACIDAELEIAKEDLKPELFENVDLVHLSAFRLRNGLYLEKALKLAQNKGIPVSLDLANASLVKVCRERLWGAIPTSVTILFANQEEAYALTGLEPKLAAQFLKNFCPIAVVKMGEKGCWVCSEEGLFCSPGIPTNSIDTTGAGDLFASAFLYGYLCKWPLKQCALLGNLAGSAATERYGAELSAEKWREILHSPKISDCIQTERSI